MPCLRPETLDEATLLAQGGIQQLDRDGTVEDGVGCRPDLAHAAAGDALGQGVTLAHDGALGGVHGFSTASMTWRAIGAATLPPNASLPAFPPFSTITATATFGSLAGANAVNQACGAPPWMF